MPLDLRAPGFFSGQAGRLQGSSAQLAKDVMIRKSPRCGPGCAEDLLRKGGEGMNQVTRVLRLPQELVAFLDGSWAACSALTMGGGVSQDRAICEEYTRTSIDRQPAVTHGH